MGNGASSENTLKSFVSANVTVINESTANCTNTVDVQSGMVISGNKWSWFGWLKQDVIVTISSTCMANLTATTETNQKIKEEFTQMAESVVKGLSFNTAQAKNAMDLCTEMATTIETKFVAIATNALTLAQPLTITNNTGTVITGTTQKAVAESSMKQVVSTVADTKAFQDLVLVADQTAKATVIGLDPSIFAVIIAAIIIAVILGFSYSAKTIVPALTSPSLWFIISTVLTVGSLYIPIAGALGLKVWPYKVPIVADPKNPNSVASKNADTQSERAEKLAFNKSVMTASGIMSGILGVTDALLLIATIATRKSAPPV
jgi:rRNA-processing protein FCF1